MRSLTSSRPAWSASSTSRASTGSRRSSGAWHHGTRDEPVQVGPDRPGLGLRASPVRSKRRDSFSACSRAASGIPASSIFSGTPRRRTPPSSPSSLRIDSICLRRKYSRCCFSAPVCTSSRMRDTDLELGEALALQLGRELQPLGHVDACSAARPCLRTGDVGRVAGAVGQRPGFDDCAQERALIGAVVAAKVEDLLDHGAVLALHFSRVLPSDGGCTSGNSNSTSTRRLARRGPVLPAPILARCTPLTCTALPPPGSLT